MMHVCVVCPRSQCLLVLHTWIVTNCPIIPHAGLLGHLCPALCSIGMYVAEIVIDGADDGIEESRITGVEGREGGRAQTCHFSKTPQQPLQYCSTHNSEYAEMGTLLGVQSGFWRHLFKISHLMILADESACLREPFLHPQADVCCTI